MQAETAPLTVYTTEHAHSSVAKAVALAGFGRDNLRLVGVDPVTYAMRPEALAARLEVDVAEGRRPAAVVASVGTTGTTAVDPLTRSSRWPASTGHGCTSMRRWRARRCCSRRCAG